MKEIKMIINEEIKNLNEIFDSNIETKYNIVLRLYTSVPVRGNGAR